MKKSSSEKSKTSSTLPGVIILISIVSFVTAVFLLLFSIGFFGAGNIIKNNPDEIVAEAMERVKADPTVAYLNITEESIRKSLEEYSYIFPLGGVISLIVMIIYILSGIYLLKRRNWARYTQIVLATLSVLASLAFLVTSVFAIASIFLIINVLIAAYLLFNKKAIEIFY